VGWFADLFEESAFFQAPVVVVIKGLPPRFEAAGLLLGEEALLPCCLDQPPCPLLFLVDLPHAVGKVALEVPAKSLQFQRLHLIANNGRFLILPPVRTC